MPLRIVFMGTPEFAVPTLRALAAAGHEVVAVYTRAPKRAGRGLDHHKSPVHEAAIALDIPVFTPKTFKDPDVDEGFAAFRADVAVVAAYGLILPQAALDAPKHGCLNLHGSLLPRWRGAAPINRALMAGDPETGVEVMKMEAGLDTGPVAMTHRLPLGPDETAGELHDRMAEAGARLMVKALSALEAGTLTFTPQSADGVTYAAKIDKAEARIDWGLPAGAIHNLIRGLSPFPGAWFEADLGRGPERIKVLRSHLVGTDEAPKEDPGTVIDAEGTIAGDGGALRLVEVQRAGGKPLSFADFARGAKLVPGTILD